MCFNYSPSCKVLNPTEPAAEYHIVDLRRRLLTKKNRESRSWGSASLFPGGTPPAREIKKNTPSDFPSWPRDNNSAYSFFSNKLSSTTKKSRKLRMSVIHACAELIAHSSVLYYVVLLFGLKIIWKTMRRFLFVFLIFRLFSSTHKHLTMIIILFYKTMPTT